VHRPAIVLADEPTANLDADYARDIVALFEAFHVAGVTLIVATHDVTPFTRYAPRIVELHDGRLAS
jgi:cell division transport system ATP-binding protein